jgi:hypothetical protein
LEASRSRSNCIRSSAWTWPTLSVFQFLALTCLMFQVKIRFPIRRCFPS